MKISTSILFIVLCCNLFCQKGDFKEILLLNSYHTGYSWTDQLTQGVINGFGNKSEYRVFVEYMDAKRFNDDEYFTKLTELYKQKYKLNTLEGIICADNYAFEFFLKHGNDIWDSDLPVTFCGVNNIDSISYNKDRFKGVREDIDVKNTLEAIFKIHSETDTLVIISDQTLSGTIFHDQVLGLIKNNYPTVPYITIDATVYSDLTNKLDKLNSLNKVIILLNLYSNKHSIPVEICDLGREIFIKKGIPIYSFWDFLLDDFIVGGCLISAHQQGVESAHALKLMMSGKEPEFNLLPTEHTFMFDNNMLERHNIDETLLPDTSIIINKPISFWNRYKVHIIIVFIILIILFTTNILMVYNISVRKKMELKLQNNEKRLELAVNSANEGLWDFELDTSKVFVNDNMAYLLGYDSINELNINIHNWNKFVYPDDLPQVNDAFTQHRNKVTDIFKCEIRLHKKHNKLGWFAIYGKITSFDTNNNPSRITGVLIDINLQKEFENELKNAKDKAEESDRLKSSFLANMSHEIRTPMNAIIGFSDIVTEQDLDTQEQHTFLHQIRYSAENLLKLINDIVDISKIESEQLDINNKFFDINELIKTISITGKSLIKNKQELELIIEQNDTIQNPIIYSDPFRIEQILLNLLSNAIKFTQKGTVTIRYYFSENTVIFKVIDTGEGIAKEYQKVIFERFRQVENALNPLYSGTGLGLSICKSLTNLMQGTISVESELHKGSTFSVELPLIQPEDGKHARN